MTFGLLLAVEGGPDVAAEPYDAQIIEDCFGLSRTEIRRTSFVYRIAVKSRVFLIFCAVGLVPIALGYGAKPSASLDALFGITVDTTNLTHIMRAVMGLYLGMVVIWLWGAFDQTMAGPALASCAVFMLGLAAGRMLSFLLDGMPHWLLIVYAVLEVVLGLIAVMLFRANRQLNPTAS